MLAPWKQYFLLANWLHARRNLEKRKMQFTPAEHKTSKGGRNRFAHPRTKRSMAGRGALAILVVLGDNLACPRLSSPFCSSNTAWEWASGQIGRASCRERVP